MNINIFGSTGYIGSKSLNLINTFYPNYKINLLVANSNYKKLILQVKKYKPKAIYLNDKSKIQYLKKKINKKINIIEHNKLSEYLYNSKSNLTILSISGYQSLNYLEAIINNTSNLGLVNKECVVSAGHLFKSLFNKNKIKIFPLDSEHFSLHRHIKIMNSNDFSEIYLTASGGPFYKKKFNDIKNVSFKNAINHPKWKMGYKNSIDSSTLANKCLEIIEAHYLFDIPYSKINAIIHTKALIHSIINFSDHTSQLNYFYHDMEIPILNFLNSVNYKKKLTDIYINNNYKFKYPDNLDFDIINLNLYPIYKIFLKLDKNNPKEIIKFNLCNEFAVELFKNNKIGFGDIHKIINNSLSIHINNSVNSIENVIKFQTKYNNSLKKKYEYL